MENNMLKKKILVSSSQKTLDKNHQELLCIVDEVPRIKGSLTATDNKCIFCITVVFLFIFKASRHLTLVFKLSFECQKKHLEKSQK